MLHGDALPDIRSLRQLVADPSQAFGTLGQSLVAMTIGLVHRCEHFLDKAKRHVRVVKIPQGVHEGGLSRFQRSGRSRASSCRRLGNHCGRVDGVDGIAHCVETASHALSVAVLTAGSDLGTNRDGLQVASESIRKTVDCAVLVLLLN